MFGSIFEPYGVVWRILNTITDVLCLSLLWAVCCLPVVTIGPATIALYDSVVHCIRYGEDGPYARFFRTLKGEWKLGFLQSLLWGGLVAIGAVLLQMMTVYGSGIQGIGLAACAFLTVLALTMTAGGWSCLIQSRFAYDFKSLTVSTLCIALGYLPATLLMMVSLMVFLWLCASFWFPIAFLPVCLMLVWSLPAEWVFAKFGGGIVAEIAED